MNRHFKNILFIILLLSVFNTAFAVLKYNDSLVEKLVAEGSAKFKKLQQENEEHIKNKEYDKLNFIVNVGAGDNLINHQIAASEKFISNSSKEQSLNQRLQQLFVSSNNTRQAYLFLISSLDFEIKAIPAEGLTIESVFNSKKFYDSNLEFQEAKSLHHAVTDKILETVDKSKPLYFISLGKYRAVYHKDNIGSHHVWYARKVSSSDQILPNYFNETYDYLKSFYASYDKRPATREQMAEDAVTAFEQAYKNAPLKAQILSTYTPEGLITIFQQFQSGDYYTLTVQERLHCLSVFAGYSMSGNITIFNNNEEGYALKLIHYVNKNDLIQFFQGLSAQSVLKNNSSYSGEKDNKVLIVKLINKIDDGPGGDNYGKLISIILNHFNGSATLLESYLSTQNSDTREIKYYSTDVIPTASEAGTINYDVTLNDNGELDIEREIAYREVNLAGDCIDIGDGCMTTHWETLDPINDLHPFEIILFTNYSKLSLVEDLAEATEVPLIAPAVVLKYCDDKDFNNVSVKRLSLALDVVTVATGAGAIKQALNAQKYARALYEAAQVLSAGGNLVVNLTNDPEIDALKQEYDNIMLVWDMANIVNGSGKLITKAYNSVKNGTAKRISKNAAQNFISHYEQLNASGKQLPANFKKLYVYLKSKVGSVVSSNAGSIFNKNAISGINGFSDNISSLVSQHNLDVNGFKLLQQKRYDAMSVVEKSRIDGIRNSIPIPDGNTILQKVIPKSDISKYLSGPNPYFQVGGFVTTAKDAKHLQSFDDIYYGMRLDYTLPNGSNPFSLTDGSCGVIRYKTPNPNLTIPKLPTDAGNPPYTGNGFTGGNSNRLGVPEWKSPYNTPNDGAELWELFSDGSEILKAKFSAAQNRFIPI